MNAADISKVDLSRYSRLVLVSVLLVAAFFRVYALELASITTDEGFHGEVSMWVIASFDFPNWPWAGFPSMGIRNSALFLYVLSIPYVIVFHPLAGVAFIAWLNVLAIVLAWRLARERFGLTAAHITAVLFAFSPWSVLYARQMWPPSCLAVVTLWFIQISLRWLDEGGKRRLTGMIVLAFVMPQIHFSGACATVWLLAVLLLGRLRMTLAPLAIGGVLGLATLAPWILMQHATDWLDMRQALRMARGNAGVIDTIGQTVTHFQSLLHSGGMEFWFAKTPAELPEYFPVWLRLCLPVAGALLVTALVCGVASSYWKRSDRSLRLLVLWSLLPVLMLLLIRPKVYPHYTLVAFPVPFILIGAFCSRLMSRSGLWSRGIVACLIFISVVHMTFLGGWYCYVDDDRLTGAGQYQLSYRQRYDVADMVLKDAGGRRIRMAGPFSGHNPSYEFVYIFEQFRRGYDDIPGDEFRLYWIDEESIDSSTAPLNWKLEKQHRMNQHLAKYRRAPPSWEIERYWKHGPTHIYRLHLRTSRSE